MLKIKNNNFKKRKVPLILGTLGIGGTFLFSFLTFIPTQTFAESLIVDPNEHRSLSNISTMQEMSQQICINSREEESKQLEDTREPGKKYWVTKLKDGNCWMTQNLDYNGGGTSTAISSWTNTSATFKAYHDPGNYAYNLGSSGQNGNCTNATFTNCSTQFSAINPSDTSAATQEKMHYHVGNYYSWNAATNGTGGTITSGEASGSICPDGWKLPTSNNANKGSFAYLLTKYGVQSSVTSGSSSIYGASLYFAYGGILYNGRLNYAGFHGYFWSSTPISTGTSAYGLSVTSSVYPSNNLTRYFGMSVRCLAEGGGFPDPILSDNQANVSITVSPVISIDVTQHIDTDVDFTRVARSNIVARVGSNQGYQVLLSTNQSNLERTPVVENQHIPMLTHDSKITAGTSNWGIKKLTSSTDTIVDSNTIYSPVGLNDNKVLFYQSTTPTSETLSFPVAIAVDSTLPSGNYSTQITLTAMSN